MAGNVMISVALLLVLSAILIVPSFKRRPGIGIIAALVIIAIVVVLRSGGLNQVGFERVDNWSNAVIISLVIGVMLSFLSMLVVEPFSERIMKKKHDYKIMENIRGNLKNLLLMLLLVWIVVVFAEEIIYRGFFMLELKDLIGESVFALSLNLVLTSTLFGVAHWYQGHSGVLSTGIIGFLIGLVFILNGFNIWMPILIHGFIDTIGLTILYLNKDKELAELLWKKRDNSGIQN